MKTPLFSIITCTNNSGKFILRNIESVANQSLKNYEQIFIDGKSIDETQDIIKKFVKKDPQKYKLFMFPPKGISDAFNKGIENSKRRYLIFLNSDDCFYDDSVLEDVYEFIKKNKSLEWFYGKIRVIEENGETVGIFPNRRIFQIASRTLLKFINYIPHQAVFIKREVFEKFGYFDTTLKTSMDRDMWFRIMAKTKWRFFDRIIADYRIRPGSVSSSKKMRKENTGRLEEVQKRYLSDKEMVLARTINKAVSLINKTYR